MSTLFPTPDDAQVPREPGNGSRPPSESESPLADNLPQAIVSARIRGEFESLLHCDGPAPQSKEFGDRVGDLRDLTARHEAWVELTYFLVDSLVEAESRVERADDRFETLSRLFTVNSALLPTSPSGALKVSAGDRARIEQAAWWCLDYCEFHDNATVTDALNGAVELLRGCYLRSNQGEPPASLSEEGTDQICKTLERFLAEDEDDDEEGGLSIETQREADLLVNLCRLAGTVKDERLSQPLSLIFEHLLAEYESLLPTSNTRIPDNDSDGFFLDEDEAGGSDGIEDLWDEEAVDEHAHQTITPGTDVEISVTVTVLVPELFSEAAAALAVCQEGLECVDLWTRALDTVGVAHFGWAECCAGLAYADLGELEPYLSELAAELVQRNSLALNAFVRLSQVPGSLPRLSNIFSTGGQHNARRVVEHLEDFLDGSHPLLQRLNEVDRRRVTELCADVRERAALG